MKTDSIPTVDATGLSTARHVEALGSAPKHFPRDRIHKATLATGITVEYSIEANADAESVACRALPEERVVLIMGFLQTKEVWAPVIDILMEKWDAQMQGRNLKVLTFDNRGVGGTDAPWSRYTTSQMAQDTLSLLDYVGWKSVHVVGISLGGMISIELAATVPERVRSLSLLVTTRGNYFPGAQVWKPLLGSIFARSATTAVQNVLALIYPPDFLSHSIQGCQDESVEKVLAKYHRNPPSQHSKPSFHALVAQGVACLTHYVSDSRLDAINQAGFPVLVVGCMQDILIPAKYSVAMLDHLKGDQVQTLFFKSGGHGVFVQFVEEVADGLKRTIERAKL